MSTTTVVQNRRRFFSGLFAVALGTLILFSQSRWDQAGIEGEILFAAGLALMAAAMAGRLWCSLYICGYKSHTLVTVGPYSLCRHPLYFFSLLGAIGIGLCTETITIVLILLAAFLLCYPFLIAAEERRLHELHGEAFENYASRTPKFWPSLARLQEPAEYPVKPRMYRRAVRDATAFLWLLGGLQVVQALHVHHLVPVLFQLY